MGWGWSWFEFCVSFKGTLFALALMRAWSRRSCSQACSGFKKKKKTFFLGKKTTKKNKTKEEMELLICDLLNLLKQFFFFLHFFFNPVYIMKIYWKVKYTFLYHIFYLCVYAKCVCVRKLWFTWLNLEYLRQKKRKFWVCCFLFFCFFWGGVRLATLVKKSVDHYWPWTYMKTCSVSRA